MKSFIGYFRVSTKKQGDSGLGLEAQRAAVDTFVHGEAGKLIADYVEVESGKRADRPQLANAIAHAKRTKATLLVAKLDRLARNVAFTSKLMESGVEFIACDNPNANRLTIHILAAVAEDEARRISERTKASLAALKLRGGQLGAANPNCRNLDDDARRRGAIAGAQAVRDQANAAVEGLRDMLSQMRLGGFSYADIATLLNARGETTSRSMAWTDVAVIRACKRLQIASVA